MITIEAIGDRIKELRKSKQFTQAQVSQITGISPRLLRYYESGIRVPDVMTARRIANALGVTLDDIFPLEGGKETA